MRNPLTIVAAMAAALLLPGTAAFAHPHTAGPTEQEIANGQLHPAFQDPDGDGTADSCESYGLPGGGSFDPVENAAWYGLETAHHGPDQGDPGQADGCYQLDDGVLSPGGDVENPAIN